MTLIPESIVLTPARRVGTIKAESPVRWLLVGGGEIVDELPQKLIVHAATDAPFTVVAAEMAGTGLASCVVSVERKGWAMPKIPLPSWGTVKGAGSVALWALLLFVAFTTVRDWIKPDDTNPPGPTPTPIPVKSFHVLLIHESGKTLPAAQHSVMYGKKTRDWLTANTAAEDGFRIFDKDQNADDDTPTIKALWTAVKPKIATVPCVAVAVNGNVKITPLAATPEEQVAVFERLKAGK